MNQNVIPTESDEYVDNLSPGDKLYNAEYVSTDGKAELKVTTYEFQKYITDKVHIKELEEASENGTFAELINPQFPKVTIKTDISAGFFKTPKDAAWSFVAMIAKIHEDAEKAFNKQFS
jgi:hypothetical protein